MIKLYDLRDDQREIDALQGNVQAGAGFKPGHFLIGTDEWWSSIDRGEIERKVFAGEITSVHWGAMGDFPGFEVITPDGTSFRYRRVGDITRYVEGLKIEATFLRLEPVNERHHGLLAETICIEDSPRRTEAVGPGPDWVHSRGNNRAREIEQQEDPS